MPSQSWRNAITRYSEEAPESLLAHPGNPKIHPLPQQEALAGAISDLGWLAPVIVNERTQHVLDGHARIGLAISRGEKVVPVAYVDLDPALEAEALLTFDPIGNLAIHDKASLDSLLREVQSDEAAVQGFLSDLAEKEGILDLAEIAATDYPSLDSDARQFTVRYSAADEPVIKTFLGQDADELLEPTHLGKKILERIKAVVAAGAD